MATATPRLYVSRPKGSQNVFTRCYVVSMSDTATATIKRAAVCDTCQQPHEATPSHFGRFGEGMVYAVVCPVDSLTDYFTEEGLLPLPAPRITWWVYAGRDRIRRQATMRGTWSFDATCSCGWDSQTGGALERHVMDKVADHKRYDHS